MRGRTGLVSIATATIAACACMATATPSTTYWTPAVSDVQPFGVWHLGIDNYFTVAKKASSGEQGAFPSDVGVTVGVLPFEKIQMEVGIDAMYPSDYPYYFNAKIGTPEGAVFPGSPAVSVGIFNVGTKKDKTDYDIVHAETGVTLPGKLGRLYAGYYLGNGDLLVSSAGRKENKGWMAAWNSPTIAGKWVLAADYASGDNAVGGGGGGVYYFFTKDVSLLVGPVWFNDEGINGSMKWTAQLDVNF